MATTSSLSLSLSRSLWSARENKRQSASMEWNQNVVCGFALRPTDDVCNCIKWTESSLKLSKSRTTKFHSACGFLFRFRFLGWNHSPKSNLLFSSLTSENVDPQRNIVSTTPSGAEAIFLIFFNFRNDISLHAARVFVSIFSPRRVHVLYIRSQFSNVYLGEAERKT